MLLALLGLIVIAMVHLDLEHTTPRLLVDQLRVQTFDAQVLSERAYVLCVITDSFCLLVNNKARLTDLSSTEHEPCHRALRTYSV